ncbi:MAG: FG-GAP-like repeat-containing protein [Deltaproteobacteria bacterium]|nr:FG-GAP-like repeat-containing protein [Deltaproteobacteria bacterium]
MTIFLVTVPGYSEDETDEGIAFLFLGSASGIGESQAWEYQSNQSDIYMGTAVTWCNVNGDGYDDVVIGTPNYDNIQGTEGQVLVFYSNGSLPSSTPDWDYESDQAGASLGRDVACAGDINGDFYDDLIVSAPNWDIEVATASISVGKVYAFYGSNGGLAAGPNWSAVGSFHQGSFGSGLAAAGDVNNDGYDDIIVGAYNVSNPENAEGRAHVFLGSSSAPSTSPDSTMEQNVASAYFGIGVSRFGDFNDDGYDDIIVTGRYNVPDATAYGGIAVFFYPGGPSGLGATPDPEWWVSIPGGENTYAALTMIDDYDGDGYPEFVFGQRAWSNGQGSEGRIGIISPYPLNDQCGQAEALGTLPASVVGKNGGAADEYTPTCGGSSGGRDVIYSFEGIFNHNYYVDLTGDFNTIVAVHYGACEGTLIGCNDDFGSLSHSRVEFTAPATDTYSFGSTVGPARPTANTP